MRPLYNILILIIICISSNAQNSSNELIEPYNYDTILKGGYTISFKVDDSLQYLYLTRGSKIISEIASSSRGILYKSLGYVGADFKDYFVLVHSYGSGNPHSIELIKKSTGQNLLKNGATWIDVDVKKEFLLYCETNTPSPNNRMTLYNIRTGQKQQFSFPKNIFTESEILNHIQISKLTEKQLIITYDTENGIKTKMYSR